MSSSSFFINVNSGEISIRSRRLPQSQNKIPPCSMHVTLKVFCQTPIPVQNWELTLLSPGNNKKNKKKKNNPHPNSH